MIVGLLPKLRATWFQPPTAVFRFASSVLSRLSVIFAQLAPAAAAASLEVSQLLLESVGRYCYNQGCF